MEVSKIQFSEAERNLMQDAGIILTKNSVLKKIQLLLEGVQENEIQFAIQKNLLHSFPFASGAKISRGEQYRGLPYLILDFPRYSGSDGLFFIRQMFWWGHFFSTTLHLSGNIKDQYAQRLSGSFEQLQDYAISIHEDPWVHHFEEDNYKPLKTMDASAFAEICESREHLKIACALPLSNWETADRKLPENWKLLLKVCGLTADAV